MTTPSATPTPITPPRVAFFDERTGLISREWYMFFLSLFRQAGYVQQALVGPPVSDQTGELAKAAQQAQLAAQQAALTAESSQAAQLAAQLSAAQSDIAVLQTAVQGLELAPPRVPFKRARYGSFYDTTTQTATTINTATAITFNSTSLTQGVYIGSPTSRVYVDTEGVYDFQMSMQLDSTVATDEHFYLWLAKNGTDIADSASTVRLQGNNSEIILSLNFFLDLKAGDYVELIYSTTNLGVQLLYAAAAPPVPAIPSIILTVNNGIEGVQ